MPPPRTLGRRARRCSVSVALVTALLTLPLSAAPVNAGEQVWIPPVDGRVVAPFREPIARFGAGHRGVDFAAAPGAAVRAVNDGRVSFAGDVAGSLHVVVAHEGGIRTSYSFLIRVDVSVGQPVRKGQVVGAAGGTGEGHGPGVLHFGVRIGERYVDPMLLFRPPDLTELVRLVPADERAAAGHKTPDQEADGLPPFFGWPKGTGDDDCAGGIPLAEQFCDAVEWGTDAAVDAFEAGLALAKEIPELATEFARGLERRLRQLFKVVQHLAEAAARRAKVLVTRLGRVLTAVVSAGTYFIESLGACDDDAPPADGSGGSGNVMFAVGGIDSHRENGDRRSFDLPAHLLGYQPDERYWFSYDADSKYYDQDDTYQDLRRLAALLAEQLKRAAKEQPGRTFDLLGHSQGGVVIDVFLFEHYRGHEEDFPPIDNVVTFASPHEGTPLATVGDSLQRNPLGRGLIQLAGVADEEVGLPIPRPDATSIRQLSEDSELIQSIQDSRVPDGINFTSIAGTDDPVVLADHTELEGAKDIRLDVGSVFDSHSAITNHPRSLMAARAGLEHRALPCTSYAEKTKGALRPALASVVVSALSTALP